ncbi:uncharacterized protein PAC_03509 [Phialocephala subalpina]|uniref:SANT domain-containing protein n=1 Tax=Phialocephala subalpina TaxID=576137 RepID=A0A1L7WLI1_9HELO|nr:uncharacterized protein PAC_03509 [Phialocephala subalpina]
MPQRGGKYRPSHDLGDSRRSPRDQSPARYNDRNDRGEGNDRDEYRGGSHMSERRRSIPDIRSNNNAFNSNRDSFRDREPRELIGRESSRDFPPRDPPRGPKGLIDAPTGPRASSYGDFRGERGDYGYRGDYRGDRGRGRGRGWRDDSRDRARDLDRNYRRDRDDRGPLHFRDEPGRDRWGAREPTYNRGRRLSPQGRGRSPTYGTRDNRDAPPGIEVDRARRGSRDGPLSGGSPSSDSVPFGRGFGRAPRGGRGRGRGGYYDDHRRSRSPDPAWNRRTQPSATPPPQVPAFGSNMAVPGPVPGVAVPTAPRSYERVIRRIGGRAPTSMNLIIDNSVKTDGPSNFPQLSAQPSSGDASKDHQVSSTASPEDSGKQTVAMSSEDVEKPVAQTDRKRKPIIGKRLPKPVIRDTSDMEDSGDELDDGYFEEEIAKVKLQIEQVPKDNPLMPRDHPGKLFLLPYIDADFDELPSATKLTAPEPCVAPKVIQQAPASEPIESLDTPMIEPPASTLVPRPRSQGKSRPVTPLLPDAEHSAMNVFERKASIPNLQPPSFATNVSQQEAVAQTWDPSAFLQSSNFTPGNASANQASQPPAKLGMRSPKNETNTQMLEATRLLQNGHPEKETDTAMPDATTILPDPHHQPSEQEREPFTDLDAFLGVGGSRRGSHPQADIQMTNATAPQVPGFYNHDANLAAPNHPANGENSNFSMRPSSAASPLDINNTPFGERPATEDKPIAAPKPRKPMMDTFSDSEDDDGEAEIIERTRKQMKTPDPDTLPRFNCKQWWQDEDFLKKMEADNNDTFTHDYVERTLREDNARIAREKAEERERFIQKRLQYRRFTEFSQDTLAVKSRETFAKAREKAAAEAAAPQPSSKPSGGAKPEGRRVGRFATEHDFERVLRESEQEAKATKEKEERLKTASAKEAKIPDMCWTKELWDESKFHDRTRLVPFDRSFAILEFGEPVDNFTEEECRIFEEIYLEFPKQFSKIAESLPGRDYKACIQHYYAVKHKSNLKEKLKKQPKKKKGRKPTSKNPKSNALMADLGLTIRDEPDEGQDAENGERRRPRRAAAPTWPIETPASESEVASPAPTPGRKTAAAPKGDTGNDAPPTKRKPKGTREKGSKQTKNNPLLAAAPSTPANRQPESPAPSLPPTDWKHRREPSANPPVPSQFDGSRTGQSQPVIPSTFPTVENKSPSVPVNIDTMPQYHQQERLESAPPMGFEQPQDRRAIQQTSSYWSVPEQTDFPALLKHFGTDWHGIAKFMTSKTHIMVYTTLFQQWLTVPSDSNKSRLVANIQSQVKNYYQRQVDSGKMKEWEDFTREADARKERGEAPPELPPPTVVPKRRYDITPGSLPRSGSALDLSDDLPPANQSKILAQASPQPSLSSRFPALAQAGPVPQIQPATPTSVMHKNLPPQPIQQAAQQGPQLPRVPRGPALGFFTQNEPRESRDMARDPRPIMQANTPVSERSLQAAQEAQQEQRRAEAEQRRAETIRLQHEQTDQQQQQQQQQQQVALQRGLLQQQALQQQVLQRERQFQMKQESEGPDLRQYEPYAAPQHGGNMAQARPDPPKPTPPAPIEQRRTTAPPHQFQPRGHQPSRSFLGENLPREIKSTPSPAAPRPPMSAPPATREQYSTTPLSTLQQPPHHSQRMSQHLPQAANPPPQVAPPQAVAPVRPQEPARKSNIMSLLNDDEPDNRPTPAKRVSDVSSAALQPSRTPPPPQQSMALPRYTSHPSQAGPQTTQMSQQMSAQPQIQQQSQLPTSQQAYGQPSPHHLHQHSSSIVHARSYTPTGFERGGYGQAPIQQQQTPAQQLYSQPPPRSTMPSQPPSIRREPSLGDMHGVTSSYARTPSVPQSRLKESPYSVPTPPPQAQALRQPAGSPLDLASSSDRDYYQRQPPPSYIMQQAQHSATSSPQPGQYHSQSLQQPQPSHRQLAFAQSPSHIASPPPQYAGQHPLHRSRHNSFDGRYQMTTTSGPGPSPISQSYAQAPQHQPTPPAGPLQMQYQQQHQGHDRYEIGYERDRRMPDDFQRRHEEQRHEQRRMDEARR